MRWVRSQASLARNTTSGVTNSGADGSSTSMSPAADREVFLGDVPGSHPGSDAR